MSETPGTLFGVDLPHRAPPADLVDHLRQLIGDDLPQGAPAVHIDPGTVGSSDLLAALWAVIPDARARHRRLGIPPEVTAAGFRDIGRKHRAYGAATVAEWLIGILRADVIELGRLQVERHAGIHGHALHIPEGEPLTPARVDASLELIRGWVGSRPLCCTTWMLDPAIIEDLPSSNLAAFARRFSLVSSDSSEEGPGGEAVSKFVFRRPLEEVLDDTSLVPTNSLERTVVARLRAGYRWSQPVGQLAT